MSEENGTDKKKTRQKVSNFLPWDEAREFVRSELIPSRGKYEEWWNRNKPKTVPRFPYRVYKEWKSWNDFLGTDNKFNEKVGTKWRPFAEAVKWANERYLKSYQEWMEFVKVEGQLPADIPARPDLVYQEWRSWNHWLANKPLEALAQKQEAVRTQVYYIIHEQGYPENVLTFGVEPMGQTALKARWEVEKFDLVRLFWYTPEKYADVQKVINALSTPYLGVDKQRIVPNIWEIVWHLQMHMEMITRPSA